MIYLDYNATAPLRPQALVALRGALNVVGNPSSLHAAGQAARRTLDAARASVRKLVGAPDVSQVVITGTGTEANALGLLGLARRSDSTVRKRILISCIEHPCVRAAAETLAREGFALEMFPVHSSGVIDVDAAKSRLGPDVATVALMVANNETGVMQPVREVALAAAEHDIPVHTDAVQAAGKIPLDFRQLSVATMAVAAHKFGGPKGVGALIVRRGEDLAALWQGGGQEGGLRPGTPAVALARGMGAAADAAHAELGAHATGISELRDLFESELQKIADIEVFGKSASRLPNTSALAIRGVLGSRLAALASDRGVMMSTGAACHDGDAASSPVLAAMGVSNDLARSYVRCSLGFGTTRQDIEQSVVVLRDVLLELRRAA